MNSQQELLDAINSITQNRDRSCDTPATVLRVEDDTVWVRIDGGADETPVRKTVNCEQGETVQVRISNGSAFLVGNASAPPTDDKTANEAHFVAELADEKATKAFESVEAVSQTVRGKVASGDSNILDLSSTMYQNANGVNIFNDTLAVGDSYAHIDGDSFDIKKTTTAGTIDDANDTMIASFGREVTVGSRKTGTVGQYSQVFGNNCVASGDYSHAEGYYSTASGEYSHAEGYRTTASGYFSHAEGDWTMASSDNCHAEGVFSTASGSGSHAQGYGVTASGYCSHAEGYNSTASGDCSHAQNNNTIAASYDQTAIGKYNISDDNNVYVFIIGNGEDSYLRSNALCVDWNGNVRIAGEVQDMSGNNKYSGGGGTSATVIGETLVFLSGATVNGETLIIS